MTESPSPLAGANVRTLTQRLCEVEAVMAVVGQLSATLRAEVLERAVARWAEDGAAPTYRVPGFGSISLSVPQQKVVVDDQGEFASWVAQRYPTEVAAGVRISCPADSLEMLLEGLEALRAMPGVSIDSQVAVADSGDTRAAIDTTTGEVVAGVKVIPGADPDNADAPRPRSISVRLDPQAKADAEAQATARLVTVLEAGLAPALAGEVRELVADVDPPMPDMPAVADEHLEADGEPDEPEICVCGHPRRPQRDPADNTVDADEGYGHRGKTASGGCTAAGCDCKRFRVPAVAW
jgi:hypothetical protein